MKNSISSIILILCLTVINNISLHGQALTVPANFPKYKITVNNQPDDGYFLMTPVLMPDKNPGYLIMMDNYGTPVYYRYFNKVLNSFVRQPNGLLSFMGRGANAVFYMMDSTFTIIDSLKAKPQANRTNPHAFIAMKNGHYLLLLNDPRTMDMTSYGGKASATVTGCVIQEQDENKNVVFTWSSWDHYKITDSYADLTVSSIDLIHQNSLELDEDGNIFLVSRSLNEVTKIDRQTGNIIWRLGGKNNQFVFTDTTSIFSMPHNFVKLPNGNFTIMDNGNERNPPYSRALEYSIDEVNKIVRPVWNFDADKKVYADNSGGTNRLATGNTVVSYGYGVSNPAFMEVHPDSSVAFRLEFPDNITSYKVVKSKWKTTLFEPSVYSIDFGTWDGYTESEYLLTMKNNSGNVVTLTGYSTMTNAFAIDNAFPVDLPAHGQVSLTVTYYPSDIQTGFVKDILTINSDINTSTLVQRISRQISLSGTKDDNTAPSANIPVAGSNNVPRDTLFYINFSEPVRNPGNSEFTCSDIDKIVIFKKGNANGENVPFDAVISTDRKMITVTPRSLLAHTQTYYIAVTNGYEDYSNNSGTAASATFRTVDLTSPVVTITPVNNATGVPVTSQITIQFDEPVRKPDNSELADADLASLIVLRKGSLNGDDVPFTATVNTEKTVITIIPDRLVLNTTYSVSIGTGLEDYNNNPSRALTSTFRIVSGLEVQPGKRLMVYPNPGSGLFTVIFLDQGNVQIRVTDMAGNILINKSDVFAESYSLDLSRYPDGMYILYVTETGQDDSYSYKLIKHHGGK
jgi:hypothetical protein